MVICENRDVLLTASLSLSSCSPKVHLVVLWFAWFSWFLRNTGIGCILEGGIIIKISVRGARSFCGSRGCQCEKRTTPFLSNALPALQPVVLTGFSYVSRLAFWDRASQLSELEPRPLSWIVSPTAQALCPQPWKNYGCCCSQNSSEQEVPRNWLQ